MERFEAIRQKAREVLRQFEERAETAAFDEKAGSHSKLEEIADACFQLSVIEDTALPEGILGALDRVVESISYRVGLEPGRRAFTVAHELGHRALEHPDRRYSDSENDVDESPNFDGLSVQNGVFRSYNSKDTFELEANVFAAELLAPSALVREKLLESDGWSVEGLRDYFGLSHVAMLNQITAALSHVPKELPKEAESKPAAALKPDPKHDEAVDVPSPALVLAGPGAGKTRILVRRYQRLVSEGFSPRRILALTFSNKAAAEMRERLALALPEHAHEITVFTFHSFGLETLRSFRSGEKTPEGEERRELELQNAADLLMTLRRHLHSMPLGSFESLQAPVKNLGVLLDAISKAKDEMVDPKRFIELANLWIERLEASEEATESELEEAFKARDAGLFYAAYEDKLRELNFLDYGDLIARTVELIEDTPAGDEIRAQYDHILVDEFQDINHASGRMVKALAGSEQKVWAVGDLRQSIYRFRGASPANIARFTIDYPRAQVVNLDRNYRSVKDIVCCGQAVEIPLRAEALTLPHVELVSDRGRPSGEPAVEFVSAPDSISETVYLVGRVSKEKALEGASSVAVLCRTRSDAQRISDALESAGIATTWPGDLESSRVFKDVLSVLYLAVGDLRGLVRLAESNDFGLDRADLKLVMDWAKDQSFSARQLLYDAADGNIEGLSQEGSQALSNLKRAVGKIAGQPTPFHALTTYLFEFSGWCRGLISDSRPGARRSLATIRQLCAVAKTFKLTKPKGRERIQEFVDCIEACISAGKLDAATPTIEDPDCVTVMTVHGSKGLEWPFVFVPCLSQGKFPNKTYHERTPVPEGLVADYDPVDDLSEEACLFYVAMTRAKDRLALSVADRYGKTAKPSQYLEPVLTKLDAEGFLVRTVAPVLEGATSPVAEPSVSFRFNGPIPYSALKSFDSCPRQFEFGYVLGLSGGDRGYRDFHRAVGSTVQWVLSRFKDGEAPTEEVACEFLASEWSERGPSDHWYERRFYERARLLVRGLVERVNRGALIEMGRVFDLRSGERLIRIVVDEIEFAEILLLKRVHYGRPAKSHLGDKDDSIPALFASIAEQEFAGQEFKVKIRYPLLNLERDSKATPTIVKNRKAKMAKLADQAELGPYPAKPGMFSCRACSFHLVCGNSGEESTD